MGHNVHHEHLLKEIAELYKPIFSKSPQAIYIYLDDEHKICNKKFADLLGYTSVQQWIKNEFPLSDILESDQDRVIEAYINASNKLKATSLEVTAVKKDKKKLKLSVIMTPISYKNEIFVIHFISPL